MKKQKMISEYQFRSTGVFRRDYLRYEIPKISGRKYFKLSSGKELWIQNSSLNEYRKIFEKDSKKISSWNVNF